LSEKDKFSEEHVFPEAVGGRFVIRTVCKPCNDKLGNQVDHLLTDHWFVQAQRMLFNLPGKSGQVPNPLERGTLEDDPSQKLVYMMGDEGKPARLHTVQSVKRTPGLDGKEIVEIRLDQSDVARLPTIVNTIRDRAGLPQLSAEEIDKAKTVHSVPSPWVHVNAGIDIPKYRRAILKIVYEMAAYWLGEDYLDDPIAARMRTALFAPMSDDWGQKHGLQGFIDICPPTPRYPMWSDETKSHIAFSFAVSQGIALYVRVFETFEAQILVTEDVAKFSSRPNMFLAIDPKAGSVRESVLEEEFDRAAVSSELIV